MWDGPDRVGSAGPSELWVRRLVRYSYAPSRRRSGRSSTCTCPYHAEMCHKRTGPSMWEMCQKRTGPSLWEEVS